MRPGLFAFAVASSFLGAALYINVVEQPARLVLDTRAMIREWKRNREPLMEAIASAGYYMWKEGDSRLARPNINPSQTRSLNECTSLR
jgi:hypothetical protein